MERRPRATVRRSTMNLQLDMMSHPLAMKNLHLDMMLLLLDTTAADMTAGA